MSTFGIDLDEWMARRSQAVEASNNAADVALQAYLRQLGFSEAQARANATAAQQMTARRAMTEVPRIRDLGVEQRRGIAGGFENRGLLRSGAHERAQAVQRREEERSVYDQALSAADQIGGSEQSLAWQIADIQNRRADA